MRAPRSASAFSRIASAAGNNRPVFARNTPRVIINAVQPDVLVKGSDWGPDNIVGRDVVEARGGRVVRMDLAPGFSSTALIEKARRAN